VDDPPFHPSPGAVRTRKQRSREHDSRSVFGETDAVGNIETRAWIEGARSYGRLRRRYWRCFLGMPASLILFGAPAIAFEDRLHPIARGILLLPFAVVWVGCWLGCAVTWFQMLAFRCPRCGKRNVVSWWSNWPTRRCKHCDLDLDPAAVSKKRPAAGLNRGSEDSFKTRPRSAGLVTEVGWTRTAPRVEPPQASVEEIDPEVARRCDFGVPAVRYVETLPRPAPALTRRCAAPSPASGRGRDTPCLTPSPAEWEKVAVRPDEGPREPTSTSWNPRRLAIRSFHGTHRL
jgi:hypothetical protein